MFFLNAADYKSGSNFYVTWPDVDDKNLAMNIAPSATEENSENEW
jgi:hypothetical protein